MKIEQHVTDSTKEQNGVWMDFDAETQFLIGSANSLNYRRAYQKKSKDLRLKRKAITEEEADELIRSCYAECILLDWKGVTKDGAFYPRTRENALWVLNNCPNVREFVFFAAQNNDNFRREQTEAAKAALGES